MDYSTSDHSLCQLNELHIQWRIQDFPRGGANSQNCYYFSHFCRKLHENERIWTPGGGARPWRPPLDPPMIYIALLKMFLSAVQLGKDGIKDSPFAIRDTVNCVF